MATQTYGTVTHMPPELLSEGRLSKAADVCESNQINFGPCVTSCLLTDQTSYLEFCPIHSSCAIDAFGVLLWEMLTGQRPWAGMRHVQIIAHKMRNGSQLKWPSNVHQDFKVQIQLILIICCQSEQPRIVQQPCLPCKPSGVCDYASSKPGWQSFRREILNRSGPLNLNLKTPSKLMT